MLLLCGKDGRRAERGPNAWNPHQAEQGTEQSLADEPPAFDAGGPPICPASDRAGSQAETGLRGGDQKHRAHQPKQHPSAPPEDITVEAYRVTDSGDEQADHGEARGEAGRECDRPERVPALRSSKHDWD